MDCVIVGDVRFLFRSPHLLKAVKRKGQLEGGSVALRPRMPGVSFTTAMGRDDGEGENRDGLKLTGTVALALALLFSASHTHTHTHTYTLTHTHLHTYTHTHTLTHIHTYTQTLTERGQGSNGLFSAVVLCGGFAADLRSADDEAAGEGLQQVAPGGSPFQRLVGRGAAGLIRERECVCVCVRFKFSPSLSFTHTHTHKAHTFSLYIPFHCVCSASSFW